MPVGASIIRQRNRVFKRTNRSGHALEGNALKVRGLSSCYIYVDKLSLNMCNVYSSENGCVASH
ncbi:hypothetical protein HanHA300_Chr10g0354041 [Helianthus annuus]|nr:hypothetical protein HanHA300_Chr10g0354041 [Helianthus annuus]KAJ0529264.1 hypothetical protein HanHA89_Chr10g0375731 [Helianthus annuus]KAJ0696147.1 hypothetical protein HanLR1_Chr10g0353601 [Helianthus annuus]